MTMRAAWDFDVDLEYAQVYLEPVYGDDETDIPEPDDMVGLLGNAFDPGIASGVESSVFVTPHRDNFGMHLRAELWDSAPPDDLTEWEEAFEASLLARRGGVRWISPTVDGVEIPVEPGRYRARICGRDFLRPEWDESQEHPYPENYRIQLWPHSEVFVPVALRRWQHPDGCGHV